MTPTPSLIWYLISQILDIQISTINTPRFHTKDTPKAVGNATNTSLLVG